MYSLMNVNPTYLFLLLLCLIPDSLLKTPKAQDEDEFSIVVLPDTQNYIQNLRGVANRQMFRDQVSWIIANRKQQKIAYVTQLGDLSQSINMVKGNMDEKTASLISEERFRACDTIMRPLDSIGMPYGIAVGNHDQFPMAGDPVGNSTHLFHKWFVNQGNGISRFKRKPFFGGTREVGSYDDHFDLFKAGGRSWIVIYLEFDADQTKELNDDQQRNDWALGLLKKYSNHTAILVTHFAGKLKQQEFSPQIRLSFEKLKSQRNLVMILGGHVGNFAGDVNYFRTDREGMPAVRTYVSDYQSLTPDGSLAKVNGGNGYLRVMRFSVKKNKVTVSTFSPYLINQGAPNQFANDKSHQFEKSIIGGTD